MGINRVVIVSKNNSTEKEVYSHEVEDLVKQGWKVKGAKPQPKPETKPKPKTEE